jgi:hypothetical protein
MARRKKTRSTRRRRSARIGAIAPRRRRSSGGGAKNSIMDALMVGGGLIAGQIISKQLEKMKALEDAKIRGAAIAAIGILGGNMLPKNLSGVALGIGASGIYTLAKELAPDVIGIDLDDEDDSLGALTPAQVDLIENMAVESELVTGDLDAEVSTTLGSSMDADVMSTVTGMDDDAEDIGEDEEEDF